MNFSICEICNYSDFENDCFVTKHYKKLGVDIKKITKIIIENKFREVSKCSEFYINQKKLYKKFKIEEEKNE